jgi:chemotaxis protein CheZ
MDEVEHSFNPVWNELRALNSSLQRTLEEFRSSFQRASIAGKDMPDARVRLDHVLKLTEEAAHRTLDLVERSGPLADRLSQDAASLLEPVRRAREAHHDSAVAGLLSRLEDFLKSAGRDADVVRGNLAEVLMAQSYQDLSGQIIRTVIKLVVELERTLEQFSRHAEGRVEDPVPQGPAASAASNGFGPAVPGISQDAVAGQESVDDLLAKMGL